RDAVSRGTLYCTLLLFGPDGRILLHHRKMKPTASERLVWGEGDGASVTAVPTPLGNIGGLICWENYMPLARAALYAQGVELYVAPTADARESWQATIRHIALEGRCFVLACNQYVTRADYPADLDPASLAELDAQPPAMCRGGSAIVGPLGDYLAGPLWDGEGMLIAAIDPASLAAAKFDFDAVGHYARPDVFRLDRRVSPDPHAGPSGAEGSRADGAAAPFAAAATVMREARRG
ncbi:MAG TPA: carbon-nitrogen hydrolase family protein, partial [Thermomicrobiales bacterium]|nr:carbon-nitrogen hydrolase family protein [Thermomicrobiales bacterium]